MASGFHIIVLAQHKKDYNQNAKTAVKRFSCFISVLFQQCGHYYPRVNNKTRFGRQSSLTLLAVMQLHSGQTLNVNDHRTGRNVTSLVYFFPTCMGWWRDQCCGREAQCGRWTKRNWTKTAHRMPTCHIRIFLVPIHTHRYVVASSAQVLIVESSARDHRQITTGCINYSMMRYSAVVVLPKNTRYYHGKRDKRLGNNASWVFVFFSLSRNINLSEVCSMSKHCTLASTGILSLITTIFNTRILTNHFLRNLAKGAVMETWWGIGC